MKTQVKKPAVVPVSKGNSLKVLQVSGEPGTALPRHYSTKDVVITIAEGSAILEINGEENILKQGDSILIPEKHGHVLTAITKLKAVIVMPTDAQIQFAD
jgi:quercetin dioxygenase-like cupin family protein